ncbi:MAG TPA: MBL fold metallo-hydrolase [Vicinamibacterales bacterium]|jgi:glyoxylase-like metal-dependent hydrolase (beta-lactamase superfamily II)|nr:MBL fold metallo-hydrolase [Vicinamibacterales bacterium]
MNCRAALIAAIALASVAGPFAQTARPPAATDGAGAVHVWPVQRNIYALFGPAGNSTVSIGDEGVLVVDTMTADAAPDLLAAIRTISDKPIRWVINTHSHRDHTGGNATIAKSGVYIATGNTRGGGGASILAFENALMRLNGSAASPDAVPEGGWPTDSFFVKQKDMFFNGEPVVTIHQPAAHTDADAIVFFRRSDVIAAGDVFTPDRYPVIDVAEGGSINGLIAALNTLLDLAVPQFNEEGGTMIVPGHGRICDESDVGDYRDMVTIVRDRVQDLIAKKMTLAQAKAARPTFDYDGVYASPSYTGDMFVEAVYRSLTAAPASAQRAPSR